MSLDERLRTGLEGLDAIEGAPSDTVVDVVLGRGRRHRRGRRLAAVTVVVVVVLVAFVVAPKALDALRGVGDRRPAVPGERHGIITTLAGTGVGWSSGDGGPSDEADLEYPVDLDFDGRGNLFVLEHGDPSNPQRVRKIDPSGRITTVVGPGAKGEARTVVLGYTHGITALAVDEQANVFLGLDEIHKVIEVNPAGDVTTVAGTGQQGLSGDGGPATKANLMGIWDVEVDDEGSLYIAGNSRIRKVDTSGIITTIVGSGTSGSLGDGGPAVEAQVNRITGVTVDDSGNVYFIDYRNGRIRKIDTDGIITTIAGPGSHQRDECFFGNGVPASQAVFCGPEHLDVDASGNVYVADTGNNRIRMIDANGVIHTIAGSGVHDYSGDGGPALESALSEPSSVAVGPDGAVYIADSGNDRVRRMIP